MSILSPKAIVIGASSGIGEALARALSDDGYEVGLVARRLEILEKLQNDISSKTYIAKIDISKYEEAALLLDRLISEMGSVDLIIINSGIRIANPEFDLSPELKTIDVNVSGFVAMANVSVKHFLKQNRGHLVGISSIASIKGAWKSSAYNASKSFVSNYMQGLRQRLFDTDISVTDIRPGFVETPMISNVKRKFWVATPQKAASQILSAVKKKKKVVYVTRRWNLIAALLKLMPESMYNAIYKKAT